MYSPPTSRYSPLAPLGSPVRYVQSGSLTVPVNGAGSLTVPTTSRYSTVAPLGPLVRYLPSGTRPVKNGWPPGSPEASGYSPLGHIGTKQVLVADNGIYATGEESTGIYATGEESNRQVLAAESLPADNAPEGEILAADFILLFHRGDHEDDNDPVGLHFIEDVAVNMGKFRSHFPRTCAVCEENNNDAPTLKEVRTSLIQDFNEWLPKCGLALHQFASIDDTEMFMRISMMDHSVEALYAEKYRLRLHVNPDVKDKLGVEQDPKLGPVSMPYLAFDMNYTEEKEKELGTPLFTKYFARTKDGSILRAVDRVRCLNELFSKVLNFDVLVQRKVLIASFPVHYKVMLSELRFEWANFTAKHFFDVIEAKQPLDLIRNYFGENIGFCFAWTGYTVRNFFVLSIIASFFSVLYVLVREGMLSLPRFYLDSFWVAILMMFGVCYKIRWTRTENGLSVDWDMTDHSQVSAVRAAFRGDWSESVENKAVKVRKYPKWKSLGAYVVTIVVTTAFLIFTAGCAAVIYSLRPYFVSSFGQRGGTLTSVLVALQINICNAIWTPICNWLVYLENPKTEMDYYSSQVWKQFLFQAFNAYISFCYILFVQPFIASCPKTFEEQDAFDACVDYCAESLVTTLATMALTSLAYMAIPYITMEKALEKERDDLIAKHEALVAAGVKCDQDIPKRSFMEQQGKMTTYTPDDQIQDMLAMIITIGYVFLFACVAPFIVLITLFVLMLSLRVNAWKLAVVLRRPYPMKATGIGKWNSVVTMLTWMGLFTSTGFIVLQCFPDAKEALKELDIFPSEDSLKKVFVFFVLERFMIFLKLLSGAFWGEKKPETIVVEKRRKYLEDHLMLGQTHGFHDMHHKPIFNGDPETLTQSHDLWERIEHEDDVIVWGAVRAAWDEHV